MEAISLSRAARLQASRLDRQPGTRCAWVHQDGLPGLWKVHRV